VIASAEEMRFQTADEVVRVRRGLLARVSGPAVLVAPYPDLSLAALMEHVSGFLFEGGAILSHLGIILREARVPSQVTAAAAAVRTGDLVAIDRDRLEARRRQPS
jgi:phosphohistidine swiveling domain-containing protein